MKEHLVELNESKIPQKNIQGKVHEDLQKEINKKDHKRRSGNTCTMVTNDRILY